MLSRHPDIAISRLQIGQADADKQDVEGQLDPTISAQIGISDEQSPSFSDFSPTSTNTAQLKGTITKPLASGGTLALDVDYNRKLLGFPPSPFASLLANPNPAYRNQLDLSYRHPLMRGAGRPAYHKQLKAVLSDRIAADMQSRTVAFGLARQALQLYYTIASDQINLQLADRAVDRSRRLLANQRMRERMGLIEKSDRLQAEALLATRLTEKKQIQAKLTRDIADLNRLMLRMPDTPMRIRVPRPALHRLPDLNMAMRTAKKYRPELRALDSQLAAAEERLDLARDEKRTQLDVIAMIGTRSLSGSPASALSRGFTFNDRFLSLSFELGDSIGRNSAKAAVRKAELNRSQVLLERHRIEESIKDEISEALVIYKTEKQVLEASNRRVVAEKAKFEEEMRRYRKGRSTTTTIIQFEEDLQSAEVQAALSRITLLLAYRQLQWSTGTLFRELGITIITGKLSP